MIKIKVVAMCDRCEKEIPKDEPIGGIVRGQRKENNPEGLLIAQEGQQMHFCMDCMDEIWSIVTAGKPEEQSAEEAPTEQEPEESLEPEAPAEEEQAEPEEQEETEAAAPRKRKRWTVEEDMQLMKMWRDGAKNKDIAAAFGVSAGIVGKRISVCLERGL